MPRKNSKKSITESRLAKRLETVEKKKKKMKERFIEESLEHCQVSVVCYLLKIHRSTYYRWRDEDVDFKMKVEKAQEIGRERVNDKAEAKLEQSIGDGNIHAIKFWLQHNHERYKPKTSSGVQISHQILTDERKRQISNSIRNFLGLVKRSANGEELEEDD